MCGCHDPRVFGHMCGPSGERRLLLPLVIVDGKPYLLGGLDYMTVRALP